MKLLAAPDELQLRSHFEWASTSKAIVLLVKVDIEPGVLTDSRLSPTIQTLTLQLHVVVRAEHLFRTPIKHFDELLVNSRPRQVLLGLQLDKKRILSRCINLSSSHARTAGHRLGRTLAHGRRGLHKSAQDSRSQIPFKLALEGGSAVNRDKLD